MHLMDDAEREMLAPVLLANETPLLKWVAMAGLLKPQGRRGELLAELRSDLPGVLVPGREVGLAPAGALSPGLERRCLRIEEIWFPTGRNAGRIVLKFSGCDSISQAELLVGYELLVQAADLPPLDPGTFFVGDLLGCDLYNGTTRAGSIVDVQFATSPDGRRLEDAAPLLAISPNREDSPSLDSEHAADPEPVLVPFVRAWLDSVDVAGRRVVMHLPAGLLADV